MRCTSVIVYNIFVAETNMTKTYFIRHFPPPYSRHYGASTVSLWHYSLAIFMWTCNLYYGFACNQVKKLCFLGELFFFVCDKKKNVWMRFCFHVWNREKKFFRIFFHVWNRVKRVLCVKTCQNSVSLETKLFLRLEAFHKHINSVLYHWKLRYLRTPPRMKTFRN